MVNAMFQSPVTSKVKPLTVMDIDEILSVIVDGDSFAESSIGSIGLITRRLSRIVNLPMVGGPAVLSGKGLEYAWENQKKLRVKGGVPYSVSVAAVRAWFHYAQTDASFYFDDLSYQTVEQAFFRVLTNVSDSVFESIISNIRDRMVEMHCLFVIPVGISLNDDIILGRKSLWRAWMTRWVNSNPRPHMVIGEGPALVVKTQEEQIKINKDMLNTGGPSFEEKMAAAGMGKDNKADS
jgi:hypothetical protein